MFRNKGSSLSAWTFIFRIIFTAFQDSRFAFFSRFAIWNTYFFMSRFVQESIACLIHRYFTDLVYINFF